MDDIYFPDEADGQEHALFDKKELTPEPDLHPSGLKASQYVKISFDRFVTLVANHSFLEVVERNKNEDVVISTNLLTDLANARRGAPNTKSSLMIVAGIVVGIFLGYILFTS